MKIEIPQLLKDNFNNANIQNKINSAPAQIKDKISAGICADYYSASVFDLNGTIIEKDSGPKAQEFYKKILNEILDPFSQLSLQEISAVLQKAGLKVEYDISNEDEIKQNLKNYILASIYNPPKYTKARERFYDMAEFYFRKGEIGVETYENARDQKTFLMRDKKEGFKILCLTKGTIGAAQAMLEGLKILDLFDEEYSTIPFGNIKNAETFVNFFVEMLIKNKYLLKKFYDDEKTVIAEIFAAGAMLVKLLELKAYPFEIYWIDRDEESLTDKSFIEALEEGYNLLAEENNLQTSFSEIFKVVHNLFGEKII